MGLKIFWIRGRASHAYFAGSRATLCNQPVTESHDGWDSDAVDCLVCKRALRRLGERLDLKDPDINRYDIEELECWLKLAKKHGTKAIRIVASDEPRTYKVTITSDYHLKERR